LPCRSMTRAMTRARVPESVATPTEFHWTTPSSFRPSASTMASHSGQMSRSAQRLRIPTMPSRGSITAITPASTSTMACSIRCGRITARISRAIPMGLYLPLTRLRQHSP
jgi:hypothetical protein